MFLGYSEKDESLLRRHNNLTVLDAVSSLDNFMREEVNNQVKRLTLTLPYIRHTRSDIFKPSLFSNRNFAKKIFFDPGIERILSRSLVGRQVFTRGKGEKNLERRIGNIKRRPGLARQAKLNNAR